MSMILKFTPQELSTIQTRIDEIDLSLESKAARVNYLMEECCLTKLEAEDIAEGLDKGIHSFYESYNDTVSSADMMSVISKTLEMLNESDKRTYLLNLLALLNVKESAPDVTDVEEFIEDFCAKRSLTQPTTEELINEVREIINDDTFIPGINSEELDTELDSLKNDAEVVTKLKEFLVDEAKTKKFATALFVCLRKGEISMPESLEDGENIDPVAVGISAAASEKETEVLSDYIFGKISKDTFLKTLRIISGVAYCCLLAYAAYLCLYGATLIAFATIYLGVLLGPLATVLSTLAAGYLIYDTFQLFIKFAETAWYWGTEKYTKFEEILSAKLSKAPEKHNKCEHYVKKVVKKAIQ